MKKIILAISGIMVFTTLTVGCSSNNTNTNENLIDRANFLIEEKYEVKIDKDDFTYNLGEVVDDYSFNNIKEGETPKIVFLRAVNKEKLSSGEVFDYSIKFNTETDEVISSECGVY